METEAGYVRSLCSLGCLGAEFSRFAVSKLCGYGSKFENTSIKSGMLESAFNRGDGLGAIRMLKDWGYNFRDEASQIDVSRFSPGSHYHCMGAKFDSLEEAKRHIATNGKKYGSLKIVKTYTGD